MSSTPSSRSKAASRTYRIKNLKRARIFINELDRSDWPGYIETLATTLTVNDFEEIIQASDVVSLGSASRRVPLQSILPEGSVLKVNCQDALEAARSLHKGVRQFQGRTESRWMHFARRALLPLTRMPEVGICEDEDWNEPVDLFSADGAPLSTPKPDIALGIKPSESAHNATSERVQTIPPLSEEFLEAIRLRKGLHPWPSLSIPDVAFPCFIFEAKSDSDVLFFAENQAAGGVAKALKMLEGLEREFQEVGGRLEHPLPVLATCTQGALWEVLIGFRVELEDSHCDIHLVQLWLGQATDQWALFQLQIILSQIVQWIAQTYRPKVENMLERIRQSFPIYG